MDHHIFTEKKLYNQNVIWKQQMKCSVVFYLAIACDLGIEVKK